MQMVKRETGASQMPAVRLPDGRFMTDTTPMIQWFESEHPSPAVIPTDPLLRFFSLLVEDYAEEWLWRPAMHYRWTYRPDAQHLSRFIAEELMGGMWLPGWAKRLLIRRRQFGGWVKGDGVREATQAHVEQVYLRALEQLSAIFATRPFLLGERPTIADFGFFASMFRHFGLDPTPSAIMRNRAPAVYEWVARVWNARAQALQGPILGEVPADWDPILREVGEAYLPYLNGNAEAWKQGLRRFGIEIQGAPYKEVPVSRYRVWCLERLRAEFEALPETGREQAKARLESVGAWEPLWAAEGPESGLDPKHEAPFGRGQKVHYDF